MRSRPWRSMASTVSRAVLGEVVADEAAVGGVLLARDEAVAHEAVHDAREGRGSDAARFRPGRAR